MARIKSRFRASWSVLSAAITEVGIGSTTVGRAIAGALGPLNASVRSLATVALLHRQASIKSSKVQRRASPNRRAASQAPPVSTAATISGPLAGSTFRVK